MSKRYSPCVGVCSATALGDEICKGCGRTEAEVIGWNAMTDAERKVVWGRLDRCLCTFAQRVVGDGCYVCNPEYQEEMADE